MRIKNIFYLLIPIIFVFLCGGLQAQDSSRVKDTKPRSGRHFVDKNGDGYNDNAPDHDGDGIPNGLDADWQKLKKGQGKNKRRRYVDLDGDGINDYAQRGLNKKKKNQARMQQDDASSLEQQQKQNWRKHKKQGHKR